MHQRVLYWAGGEATAQVSYLKSLLNLCKGLNVVFVSELIRDRSSNDPVWRVALDLLRYDVTYFILLHLVMLCASWSQQNCVKD